MRLGGLPYIADAGVMVSQKGFAWEQATLVAIMLIALLPCRQYFFRHGRIFAAWNVRWMVAIAMTCGLIVFGSFLSARGI